MISMTMNAILQRVVSNKPDAQAYATPGRNWTFKEIDEESSRVARGLMALGIGPSDRVACLTKHTADCVVLMFAACKIGAVCMPVNWRLAAPEIEYILQDGRAQFVMCDEAFMAALAKASLPLLKKVVATDVATNEYATMAEWRAGFPAAAIDFSPKIEDTALQLYSSGTTGLPKGVELSHINLGTLFEQNARAFGYSGERSVLFNALPTFHIAGIGLALLTVAVGGRTVLYPDFDPPRIIAGIAQHGITHVFLVPAMILALLHTPGVESADYRSLEVMAYGASPISEKVLTEAMRVFKCGFLQVYGLTETTGSVTFLPPEDHDPKGPRAYLLRSAGKPGESISIRVVDPASGQNLDEGEVGEVWIHGVGNMKGYWNQPKATEAAFPEGRADQIGWFRTGDAGYLRDGYLFIHDRIKDMIVSGGENIYPAEVENALMKHPALADVAVIGVPDDQWGEAVKAIAVVKPGSHVTSEEIVQFCREAIAHFKCPRTVEFRDALPRNPSGKLLKYQLRKPYWEGFERQVH